MLKCFFFYIKVWVKVREVKQEKFNMHVYIMNELNTMKNWNNKIIRKSSLLNYILH